MEKRKKEMGLSSSEIQYRVGISVFEFFIACRGQIHLDNRALQYTKKLLVVFYVRATLASARRV
jgi:hypothetical protein